MRVIAGSAKGHRLKCIKGLNTRPTADRVKESIFNIITNYIQDSNVLDLYSGTGNFAIEALSRGARFAVLVDNNFLCVRIINENLRHTKLEDRAKVLQSDVIPAINILKDRFDIIFMDPPYHKGNIIPTLDQIHRCGILNDNGLIIVERSKDDQINDNNLFNIVREVDYGSTIVSFLKS